MLNYYIPICKVYHRSWILNQLQLITCLATGLELLFNNMVWYGILIKGFVFNKISLFTDSSLGNIQLNSIMYVCIINFIIVFYLKYRFVSLLFIAIARHIEITKILNVLTTISWFFAKEFFFLFLEEHQSILITIFMMCFLNTQLVYLWKKKPT